MVQHIVVNVFNDVHNLFSMEITLDNNHQVDLKLTLGFTNQRNSKVEQSYWSRGFLGTKGVHVRIWVQVPLIWHHFHAKSCWSFVGKWGPWTLCGHWRDYIGQESSSWLSCPKIWWWIPTRVQDQITPNLSNPIGQGIFWRSKEITLRAGSKVCKNKAMLMWHRSTK
jgi:hypothetical protein